MQLFNPLIHCNFFSKNDQDELRKIVAWNARRGAELLHHARRLYSSRFFMPLLSFCLLHHCDALVRYSPEQPIASETVQFCLEVLQQTRVGFPLCGPLQSLFRQTAEECGVQVSHLANMVDSFTHYNMDDILDACTRLSYTQPLDQILRHFDPEIGREWGREWERQVLAPKGKGRRESSSGRYLQIDNILND